ncbi:SAM-dependent methyltransferase [Mesorhizobium sp. M0140]|uniref:Eco57I restriction-modification methylase domain-containing protein n=1 Tax=Mesorhizobium sp. M0140 TaxID=2956893 RepID=UPI0033358831
MSQHYLATPLRRALERTIKEARLVAEAGAAETIRRLGVAQAKAPDYLSNNDRELRRRLRAHARTLGDRFDKGSDEQEIRRLTEAAAYAHWHRMLFARFLAERGLLRHPEHNVPVSLEDCREIAQEEGSVDAWTVAERYAASMLPAVFPIDDPVLSLTLDPGQGQALHRLVTDLDDDVFQAEDSLGWTYQFWRAAEKDAVNKKGDKIGADEISAVTQLFTEPYMVRFLLHNTLGAWWAGKVLAADTELAQTALDEDTLRSACSLPGYAFDMLRFVKEGVGPWRPAAGIFPGWPKAAKPITVLDPCCGSGHFLTEALAILTALRHAEEGLSQAEAVTVVLRDNLYGLEIDGRCVQIAAFAVALTAWRIGGWQTLPLPHIAWVGAPPPLPKAEFMELAEGNKELERALASLHDLFTQAPILGSLLEPTGGDLVNPMRIARVEDLLEPLLVRARKAEPVQVEGVVAARGMADATAFLTRKYTLQVTNVPYLGRGKQTHILASFIERVYEDAKSDLATAMLSRMMNLASKGGVVAAVTPQSWLFSGGYKKFRQDFLSRITFNFIGALGSRAFETISGEVVNTALVGLINTHPNPGSTMAGIDANGGLDARAKSTALVHGAVRTLTQSAQGANPDSRIAISQSSEVPLLRDFASSFKGIATGDMSQFIFRFWEFSHLDPVWSLLQEPPTSTGDFTARAAVLRWENGKGSLLSFVEDRLGKNGVGAWLRGGAAWGNAGVAVAQMGSLPATLYSGTLFDESTGAIIPKNSAILPAMWCFLRSKQFADSVRQIDKSLKVPTLTLLKVPFDLQHWELVAAAECEGGLPEPYSADPTQWLFHGHPAKTDRGSALHVALARLSGYRWPAESDKDMRLSSEAREWIAKTTILPEGDNDGLLALSGVAGEKPLADRLRSLLAAAFGVDWSDALERRLVAEADEALDKKTAKDGSLEAWLCDRAFRQHCGLFHQRPFLWHIWDGLKDGFSVIVHYHRFTRSSLRKLTYTTLGDWLARAKAESNDLRYEKGRELQQKLEKVLEGEAPLDIFVRWKPLTEQPLGWDPDLDDGVRMNIRPFMEAGILREPPKGIKWVKDRGNDVPSAPWYPVFKGERINDHHTTLDEKRTARASKSQAAAAQ